MQFARRVALVAVLALVGTSALAGCRSDPHVAAYAGDRKYTVEQLDALVAEGTKVAISDDRTEVRQVMLSWLLIRDVGRPAARERNLPLQPASAAQLAENSGLPADSPLAQLYVDVAAVLQAFATSVEPVEPTEADQREAFSSLRVQGNRIPNGFAQVRPYLTRETIGRQLALRGTLADLLADGDVVVNPKYAPVTYPVPIQIGGATGRVYLQVSTETSTVRDRV